MKAYFDRHQGDKKSPHWDEPSPGKVAWYAWGGDAGYSWAKSVVEKLNKVQKGDVEGHPFHGNQYESGESGLGTTVEGNNFQSWGDVQNWGKANGITIDEKSLTEIAKMTPQGMSQVADCIDKMGEKYPGLTNELTIIEGRDAGKGNNTLASVTRASDGSRLSISERTGQAFANPEAYAQAWRERLGTSNTGTTMFKSCCGETPIDTINHELGHVVQNMMVRDGTLKEPSGWRTKTNPYVFAAQKAGFLGRDGKPTLSFIAGYQVSSYASSSPLELHAEVMSLLQRPEAMSLMNDTQKAEVAAYVSALNEKVGSVILKNANASEVTVEDDFNLGQDFWDNFHRLVAKDGADATPTAQIASLNLPIPAPVEKSDVQKAVGAIWARFALKTITK
jgi:hypothetical protein